MMECPKCKNGIECICSIKTEESDMPVERSYQWWKCKGCHEKYFAISEDSHVNMFDDRTEHKGYFADETVWEKTLTWALQCPDHGNTSCKCEVHQNVPPSGFIGGAAWYRYD
jgi:hypothetical protein